MCMDPFVEYSHHVACGMEPGMQNSSASSEDHWPQAELTDRKTEGCRLVDQVRCDICDFLTSCSELLFNERDLQMHLALWLRQSDSAYDDVDLEYFVPYQELDKGPNGYLWENELRLDIVVRKGREFLPVELKYKTRRITCATERFGEKLGGNIEVVKNQGAQDLGMYNFWKDVRRLELVRRRFHTSVKNGLSVFVTNDPKYLRKSPQSNHEAFGMSEGVHETRKCWGNRHSACAAKNPNFEVEQPYAIHWHRHNIVGNIFYFCIVQIGESDDSPDEATKECFRIGSSSGVSTNEAELL